MRAIDYFDKGADAYPDRPAFLDRDTALTYREAKAQTESIARALMKAGMKAEERAAIHSPNDARIMLSWLGLLRAGGVWVPVNARNAMEANAEFMKYAGTTWLFYHSQFGDAVSEFKKRVPTLQHFVCLDAEHAGNPSLEQFMASGAGVELEDWGEPRGNAEHLMGLVPTGGTTGPAKGVMVTNLAWGTMLEMASHYWRGETDTPVCLSTAPLSHAAGVVAFAMFPFGATNVVMPSFDALEVLQSIEKHRVSHIFLPPTAFYAMLAHPDLKKFDYSSLRVMLLGAAPVSPDKLRQGIEVFGPCMCQCYGQTEAPMLMTFLDSKTLAECAEGKHVQRLRSCGKPTTAIRLALMDESGNLLPPNQPGEIVARGSLVNPGYYNLPEATAEIHTHGWHHTGDIGYRDDDGFFYIVDRKKDMIITGGFNVFCTEVESAVMELPQVRECAVIGVPDEKWGEAVKAIVACRDAESLTEAEIIAHCKARLGGVKAPKSVDFRDEIPKTPAAKMDKKVLRAPYWAGKERSVH